MSEYDRSLAVDRVARKLGLTVTEVNSQLEEFQKGNLKPSNKPSSGVPNVSRDSAFKNGNDQKEGSPNYLENTHKYRFSYDPSHSGKKRQQEIDQAIVCPNCSAALGIPSIRPITIKCPACMNEATFEN